MNQEHDARSSQSWQRYGCGHGKRDRGLSSIDNAGTPLGTEVDLAEGDYVRSDLTTEGYATGDDVCCERVTTSEASGCLDEKIKDLHRLLSDTLDATRRGMPRLGVVPPFQLGVWMPPTAPDFSRKTSREYGDVRRWFSDWKRDKKLDDKNRACHETRVLVDIVCFGLCIDQLNAGSLAVFELACRRLQAVSSAYSNPSRVNWSTARLMTVAASVDDAVQPALRGTRGATGSRGA